MNAAATQNFRPSPPELAAAENLSPEFLLMLAALGFEVLIVRFQALHDSPVWEHPGIELVLEKELIAIEAGNFDSEFHSPGARWFFFHVGELGKAMAQIETTLAALGLLEITTLFHVETAQELRVWYPPTAELVKTTDDET